MFLEGDKVHREQVINRVKNCSYDELVNWEQHVLFCLEWHRKDNNAFEIDDCEFLLKQIKDQMSVLDQLTNA